MIKETKSKITSKDLKSLGFQKVSDDKDQTDLFYALAIQNMGVPNKLAYSFISDGLNADDAYNVYIIGYDKFAKDVMFPVKDPKFLNTLITLYLKKSIAQSKIFN